MFGPKPATHDHCTLGGMIGNNSCGATAQAYGKTVDNVLRLEVLTYDGERFWAGPTSDEEYAAIVAAGGRRAGIYRALRDLSQSCADQIRDRYPQIPRRVSGYNLDSLLPEQGFDVARALVGSESTLVTILHAELRLVAKPAAQALVVLGYPDIASAADAAPSHRAAPPRAAGGPGRPADHVRARAADEPRGAAPAAGGRRLADGHLLRGFPGRGRRQGAGPDRRPARHRARADGQVLRRPGTRGGARRCPRGGPGCHRPRAGHARHLGRLGGLRGPAGPAGRLPAGPAQALRRVRLLGLGPVRALRPGLRAHQDPVRPGHRRGHRDVPPVHRAGRGPGGVLRRLVLRRARRRPVPRRAAAHDVRR